MLPAAKQRDLCLQSVDLEQFRFGFSVMERGFGGLKKKDSSEPSTPPENQRLEPKNIPLHQFLGSMLIFQGVYS